MAAILPIFPEIMLLAMSVLVLVLDPFQKQVANRRTFLGMFTAIVLLFTFVLSLIFGRPSDPILVFGGMLRFDWLGFLFEMLFVLAAGITALFFMDEDRLNQ